MEPITSQRGRKRAVDAAKFIRQQIVDLQRKHEAEIAKFEGMRDLLRDQLGEIDTALAAFDGAAAPTPAKSEVTR